MILLFLYLLLGFIFASCMVLLKKKTSWGDVVPHDFLLMAAIWPFFLMLELVKYWIGLLDDKSKDGPKAS